MNCTPSQTIGPFFAYGLTPADYGRPVIVDHQTYDGAEPENLVCLQGVVYDGNDSPIGDALLEIWQADESGHYVQQRAGEKDQPTFSGFARAATNLDGEFLFKTIRPGPVALPDGGLQAPHINLVLFLRGLLTQVFTRIYFSDAAEANAADPVLGSVNSSRRKTLVAEQSQDDSSIYRFDIHMQGERETVFFDRV